MAHPLWSYPEIREGRIAPSFSSSAAGSSYGYTYPITTYQYYGYTSGHVFCLGRDVVPFTLGRLELDATARVEQSLTVTTQHKLLLFVWHMRVPTDLPQPYDAIVGGTVDFIQGAGSGTRGLIALGDGLSGVILQNSDAAFQSEAMEGWVTISGAGAAGSGNDGFHRLVCVPSLERTGQSRLDRALVEHQGRLVLADPAKGSMAEAFSASPVTIRVHGLQWVGRAFVDWGGGWEERVALTEMAGHNYVRGQMALHVSQYVGPLSIRFELKLELV